MQRYPGRVYSKPEFVALPPFLFSGAEFALIPSRDEPFGLVAVEFGRKGALGVGSRVGGLGQMPGWWYPIEVIIIPSCPRNDHGDSAHDPSVPGFEKGANFMISLWLPNIWSASSNQPFNQLWLPLRRLEL